MATEQSDSGTGRAGRRDALPADAPSPAALEEWFLVTDVRVEGDRCYYFGHAQVGNERLSGEVWPVFDDAGYEVTHHEEAGEDVLVASQSSRGLDGVPWTQLVLFVLTIGSTLFAGSMWFHVDPVREPTAILRGWPFAVGVLTVLGAHEFGHYVMTRYHGVDATLPYFIPVPTLIGTMGAVIRMKGRMPNRRALFDIGVAGPVAGLVATVAVTVVGLQLDPVTAPAGLAQQEGVYEIQLGHPWLLVALATATGEQLESIHPVVVAGWVGMFVTFLNLIPVGQLDGGHVVRAVAPQYHRAVGAVVPVVLYGLAGYLLLWRELPPHAVSLWIVWGTVTLVVGRAGAATPVDDSTELGTRRRLLAALTFLLGLACFAAVPIRIVG